MLSTYTDFGEKIHDTYECWAHSTILTCLMCRHDSVVPWESEGFHRKQVYVWVLIPPSCYSGDAPQLLCTAVSFPVRWGSCVGVVVTTCSQGHIRWHSSSVSLVFSDSRGEGRRGHGSSSSSSSSSWYIWWEWTCYRYLSVLSAFSLAKDRWINKIQNHTRGSSSPMAPMAWFLVWDSALFLGSGTWDFIFVIHCSDELSCLH